MKLAELISVLSFYELQQDLNNISINNIQIDHRLIKPGDLFICIRGFTVDGHDFASLAVKQGAVAVVAEEGLSLPVPTIIVSDTSRSLAMLANKIYHYPSKDMSLIGITGTNGKTTTTYLLESIFKHHNKKTGLIGTIQTKIGDVSYNVSNTTPNALVLQQTLRQMKDEEVDVVCMEVSSHALDLGRVYGCDYDIAIYTNLSQDHLDFHENMEDYLRAKSLLFAQLGNAYVKDRSKFAIVNQDDQYSDLIKRSTSQKVLTYGYKEKSDVTVKNLKLDAFQTIFTLITPIGSIEVTSKLIGMFNVYNMLAASSAAIAANVPLTTIKESLENISGVDGRFEQVTLGQSFGVIVDYAHTADSLENVLQTITDFATGKIYCVVGCGGDRDKGKRPEMAKVALKYANQAIFTSDNPRTEDPESIVDDMTRDLEELHYEVIIDRRNAIEQAVNLAQEGDVVLIAGKGHETYQEINRVKYDFDDRLVAKEAIRNKELK